MDEVLPGVWHWSTYHPNIRKQVHSHWIEPARTVLDPLDPPAEFPGGDLERVVLTNRHHLRDSEKLGVPIFAPEVGLHEFEGGPEVTGYAYGEEVVPGITAHEMGAICPDDAALHVRIGDTAALALADGVIRWHGELAFVPDWLLGDPEKDKRGLRESIERLLELDFEHLLFAHGEPLIGGGPAALREFLDRGTPSADF